jgi:23S rRNA (cytidine1920-2'-O)/16S rRNA (cytidine1409-2'-O)-methyltransferase
MRLDMLVKEKFNISRQKAQELIKSGSVTVDGKAVTKSSFEASDNAVVSISDADTVLKYVGRGGYKLERAVEYFGISLSGRHCLDIGASTGGFTDCMLQNGAEMVIAVDVGSSQLSDRLRADNRVVSLEHTDIRAYDTELYGRADFIGCDVSFISLSMLAEDISRCLSDEGEGVVLIKPQFEAGREHLSKCGIVRDIRVHKRVIREVTAAFNAAGIAAVGLTYSPIRGGDGNTEYLLHIKHGTESMDLATIESVVSEARDLFSLKKGK